jgi:hypothetical protein
MCILHVPTLLCWVSPFSFTQKPPGFRISVDLFWFSTASSANAHGTEKAAEIHPHQKLKQNLPSQDW